MMVFDCTNNKIISIDIDKTQLQSELDIANNAVKLSPPPPDITGLITALTNSPSIDTPTKQALIASLKGK